MSVPVRIQRFPVQLLAVLLMLVFALLLGGVLGYSLKASTVVSGAAPLAVVQHSTSSTSPADYGCIIVHGRKAC